MENNVISFPIPRLNSTSHLSCQCCSKDVRPGRRSPVDGGSRESFETSAYRGHKINEYVSKQVSILAVCRELLLSQVTSYHGSAISVVMIRYRRSILQATVDGNLCRRRPRKSRKDNIMEWTGRSDDRGRWAVISADESLGLGVPQRRMGVTGIS